MLYLTILKFIGIGKRNELLGNLGPRIRIILTSGLELIHYLCTHVVKCIILDHRSYLLSMLLSVSLNL